MSNRLYVGNLSFGTSTEALQAAFAEAGDVVETKIILDRDSGQPRGFAFVTMGSSEAARRAISQLNGAMLDGRPLRVNEAEERQQGGGGGGGGGGGFKGKRGSSSGQRW
jgi:cold-inducible RNA-binding protein